MVDLTVSYQYTKQDIINFVLDSYSFEKVRCTLLLIFSLSAFVAGIVFLFMHKIVIGVLFLIFALFTFPILLYMSYIAAEKGLEQITNVACTLEEEGFSFMTNVGNNIILYKDICDIKLTEELIFIYLTRDGAIMIPKRAFKSLDKALDFASVLLSRYNDAKLSQIY